MNKKHFIIPNIITFIAISLIVFLIPVKIQNTIAFSIIFAACLLFNIISSIIIVKNNKDDLKKDIYNIPIIYVSAIFEILLFGLLIISKLININTNMIVIILILLLLVYCILLYFLIFAKKYIVEKEENIKFNTLNQKQWLTKLEILVSNNSDKELYSLYEMVKYMDKTQNNATTEVDAEINSKFEKIDDSNISNVQIKELMKLIEKRNILNKNNK